jgi:hypothetical protein
VCNLSEVLVVWRSGVLGCPFQSQAPIVHLVSAFTKEATHLGDLFYFYFLILESIHITLGFCPDPDF